jgi:hypothetical protein
MENDEMLKILLCDYLKLQEQEKKLKENMDEKKERIKIIMNEMGITFFENSNGDMIKKLSQTRESLDKARVKELLGEIQFKEVVKTTSFESLRIQSAESKERQMKFFKEKR